MPPRLAKAAARIAEIAGGGDAVYGVNTGFGKLAAYASRRTMSRRCSAISSCRIAAASARRCADIVRLIMALKLISLGAGASGVGRRRSS